MESPFVFNRSFRLHHQSADKTQDSVELGKSSINQGVGKHIVTLTDAHDTIGTNLPLTHSGDHTDQTHAKTHTEDDKSVFRIGLHLAQQHEESHETIDTLGSRQCRQHHEITRCLGTFLETAFSGITCRRSTD